MTEKMALIISGMHCVSCAKIIESALEEKEGVISISVDYDSKKAFLEFDTQKTNLDEVKNVLKALGYTAS